MSKKLHCALSSRGGTKHFWLVPKTQLTSSIQSLISHRVRPYAKECTFQFVSPSSSCALIPHISVLLRTGSVVTEHVGAVNNIWLGVWQGVPAGWHQARHVRGVAWLDASCRRKWFTEVRTRTCLRMRDSMCSFSNRWQRSGDWREETEDKVGEGGQSVVFPFSSLIFKPFIYLLALAWTLLLCVTRWCFDTACPEFRCCSMHRT